MLRNSVTFLIIIILFLYLEHFSIWYRQIRNFSTRDFFSGTVRNVNVRYLLRSGSVFIATRTQFSTSIPCKKKKGLIRRPLRVWTPEEAKKLAEGGTVEEKQQSGPVGRFPDHLTNKRFTLPKGVSFVKLEDGDKEFK